VKAKVEEADTPTAVITPRETDPAEITAIMVHVAILAPRSVHSRAKWLPIPEPAHRSHSPTDPR